MYHEACGLSFTPVKQRMVFKGRLQLFNGPGDVIDIIGSQLVGFDFSWKTSTPEFHFKAEPPRPKPCSHSPDEPLVATPEVVGLQPGAPRGEAVVDASRG